MNPQIATIARFIVLTVIGYLVALLAKQGIHVPAALEDTIVAAITSLVAGLLNVAWNWLSHRFPWLGHLLVARPVRGGKAAVSR